MWDWSNMGWGMMMFGGLFMIIIWGGIIALVVWAIIKLTGKGGTTKECSTSLEIAKQRYAKGEISKEQFDQIKRDLS